MNERTNEPTNEWTNEWMNKWMTEWLNDWMTEWLNDWLTDWLNEWMICVHVWCICMMWYDVSVCVINSVWCVMYMMYSYSLQTTEINKITVWCRPRMWLCWPPRTMLPSHKFCAGCPSKLPTHDLKGAGEAVTTAVPYGVKGGNFQRNDGSKA